MTNQIAISNKQSELSLDNDDLEILHALYRQMRGTETFEIYAFGGKEGDRFTYVAKTPYSVLSKQFSLVPQNVSLPKNLMLQRNLVQSRSTNIQQYIVNNENFIFPEVISICEIIDAEPVAGIPNLFKLTIPTWAFRYLVDGQGRLMGITKAQAIKAELDDQTVDIKFVLSEGVIRDAQVFSDINMTPVSPNKSQCAAMDNRQAVNRFAKRAVDSVAQLTPLIDYTKNSVTSSSTSQKLWTLNQMVAFVLILTGTTAKSSEKELGAEDKQVYWTGFIAKYFLMLQTNDRFKSAITRELTAQEVRAESIIGTSVFLKSIALMGKILIMHFINKGDAQADWSIMKDWGSVDLSTNNVEWIGRCKNFRGGFEDKSFNHKAMASYFLTQMGVEMPEDLETIEEEVLMNRAQIMKSKREADKALKANNFETLPLLEKEVA
jgi:DGQHR domain-containing protein